MDSPDIAHNIFPYLIQYKDGSIRRLAGTQQTPPGLDRLTHVTSKDILIQPESGLWARIYRPEVVATNEKLPLVIYFHGGAFLIASPSEPFYHQFCNALVGSTRALLVSVGYHLAPEHPLPQAFHDAWTAVQWIAAHADGTGPESWLTESANFEKVFLSGDSAGATLAHHVTTHSIVVQGIALIHPYFWGTERVGVEGLDPVMKEMVDKWWEFVCPTDKGCDDPLINPFMDCSGLDRVKCERMLVMVAEKDILRDRGRLYYDKMVNKLNKNVEFYETFGEDHVFYLFNLQCHKAKQLLSKIASFINHPAQAN